jgi:hypothetical protein
MTRRNMPEEANKEEPQKPQNNPAGAPESNGASTAEDLAAIKAELEEERKARAAIEAALAGKDTMIADLQAKLTGANHASEAATAELTALKDAHSKAVAKYLGAIKLANPAIPGDVITGATIEEIDSSIQKATVIATAVKANLEAQAKEARVPAGAPPRTEISLEGLSPREKIVAGIHQKGGTS